MSTAIPATAGSSSAAAGPSQTTASPAVNGTGSTAPVSSTPVQPVDSAASGVSASSVESTNSPLPTPAAGSLIAVAFHSMDPNSKQHHIKPAVCTSSASLKDIASGGTNASGAADSTPAVTDAYNAAIDLVNFLDEQLARPPSMGETFTSLVRPASKEMASRIHKAEKKIGRGQVKVPGKMSGWGGERRVVGAEWNEFSKVFGSA